MDSLPIAKTWADKFAWMSALLAAPLAKDALTNGDKIVGIRLALHLNVKSGRCFPKVDPTLMAETSLSRQSVQGALQRLIAGGWIVRIDRPGTSSEFKFLMIRVPASGEAEPDMGPSPVGPTGHPQLASEANPSWPGGHSQLAHNIEHNIEENTEFNLAAAAPLALTMSIEAGSGQGGLAGKGPKLRTRRADPKRGQYETEIRVAVGSEVFDDLSLAVIEGLCARWPHGLVSAADLDALRLKHLQARATGPALKKSSSV